jgi:large subunit ribosomal protein L7Ae
MAKGKKDGQATTTATKGNWKSQHSHLFPKDARDYRVGRDIQPKRDLSRFVKWPRYVRLQRQRSILKKRLKVPPAINQFAKTLDKAQATTVFKFLAAYRPESRIEKRKRQQALAAEAAKNKDQKTQTKPTPTAKPQTIKHGINHITTLVEQKKAKLVVIANDVDPIELVVWLPALCRKMEVPYCIVKNKARLGQVVNKKTCTAVAVTDVRKEDAHKLEQLAAAVKPQFNEDVNSVRKWGGGILGHKAVMRNTLLEKKKNKEAKI